MKIYATVAISKFFNKLDNLKDIDWAIMKEKYWGDTDSDNDRKRRREAEFLVYKRFPWSCIQAIVVMTPQLAEEASMLIGSGEHIPKVSVNISWYY